MKVKDLIKQLSDLPLDSEVYMLWDGATRSSIDHVWLGQDGYVVAAGEKENCYSDSDRPKWAPTVAENKYWLTPKITMNFNG